MGGFLYLILYVGVIIFVSSYVRKRKRNLPGNQGTGPVSTMSPASMGKETSAMPHKHRPAGHYDTFNKKRFGQEPGAMPHKHEKEHYRSMADASKLPPGYILLNGEPVRVADLEGK